MLYWNNGVPGHRSSLCGAVAHLGERFNGIEEVAGSIPASSTTSPPQCLVRLTGLLRLVSRGLPTGITQNRNSIQTKWDLSAAAAPPTSNRAKPSSSTRWAPSAFSRYNAKLVPENIPAGETIGGGQVSARYPRGYPLPTASTGPMRLF